MLFKFAATESLSLPIKNNSEVSVNKFGEDVTFEPVRMEFAIKRRQLQAIYGHNEWVVLSSPDYNTRFKDDNPVTWQTR